MQGGEPLRRSSRLRQPVFRPDNVYGDQNPADIFQQPDTTTPGPEDSRRPGPSEAQPCGQAVRSDALEDQEFSRIVQEGGTRLINFLLRAAVSPTAANGKTPNVDNVREWHYRDIMRLPQAAREEWKAAMQEELEAL